MHVKKMLAPAVIAAVIAASPAFAGKAKPAPGPAPDCLSYEHAHALAADGETVHLDATVRNGCFPAVDMEGTVSLSLGGQVLAQAPLGPFDDVTIPLDIPLDALRGQQICLEFKGTRAEMVRRKLQITVIDVQDCRTVNF